ncbi:Do family serine endopeptidase [Sulfitobacter guttiformis]|uniref:Probable periplasmic serine endoprotease DegP-like n=1 Tax=Sulfitobacter guttiformis TaxID=74349 RepID=A0A420DQK2_9RHOB|nr:Do family serine endopeptidase [Sulfitobacter guttiformis]KIN73809.1 putative trypsin-like serine protease [Sulfitobacter guttiformis KCTC 32187]RKE96443.1 serine protease Do [Sulfitobacter guttiformis]
MTSLLSRSAPIAIAAALALTPALAPTVAFAVPAGGYGDLVEQVAPAVVFIEVTGEEQASRALPDNIPEALRKRFEEEMPEGSPRGGLGSGFIISADGQIVTNHHVVDGASTVKVKLADGRSFMAEVIGSDPATDIALLSIKADVDLPFVGFGNSDTMRVGDEVVAVGNPFGLSSTVTSGIISAKSRDINSGPYDEFIQTDAAINRGNSGGPLFNNDGDVIGVNTAIISPGGGSVGIGFAVPSDVVRTVVADLADDGTVTRGWLGVSIRPMSDEVAQVLGYEASQGAVIEAVSKDSPAAAAGLESGDIILSFEGNQIKALGDLTRAVAAKKPGDTAAVSLLRRGKEMSLSVKIGTLAPQEA